MLSLRPGSVLTSRSMVFGTVPSPPVPRRRRPSMSLRGAPAVAPWCTAAWNTRRWTGRRTKRRAVRRRLHGWLKKEWRRKRVAGLQADTDQRWCCRAPLAQRVHRTARSAAAAAVADSTPRGRAGGAGGGQPGCGGRGCATLQSAPSHPSWRGASPRSASGWCATLQRARATGWGDGRSWRPGECGGSQCRDNAALSHPCRHVIGRPPRRRRVRGMRALGGGEGAKGLMAAARRACQPHARRPKPSARHAAHAAGGTRRRGACGVEACRVWRGGCSS